MQTYILSNFIKQILSFYFLFKQILSNIRKWSFNVEPIIEQHSSFTYTNRLCSWSWYCFMNHKKVTLEGAAEGPEALLRASRSRTGELGAGSAVLRGADGARPHAVECVRGVGLLTFLSQTVRSTEGHAGSSSRWWTCLFTPRLWWW